MGILEQIEEIKHEMARTQKNKATEHHLGRLKARIAQLEAKLIEEASRSSNSTQATFEVKRMGMARVALVGFPSVGKSSLLSAVTNAKSAVAAYEFTTLTCISGEVALNGAKIQLLDLPGIIKGASRGIGKGKQVIATARTADLILLMLDALRAEEQEQYLLRELRQMGVRLDETPPDIAVQKTTQGGVKVNFVKPSKFLDEKGAAVIAQEYGLHNCEIAIREQDVTADRLIDALSGGRVYIPSLKVINKVDTISIEAVRWFASHGYVPVSVELNLGVNLLLTLLWKRLRIVRVFTKKRGETADLGEPVYLTQGQTVQDFCLQIHKEILGQFASADVWGTSVKQRPQKVGLQHILADGDVIQINFK